MMMREHFVIAPHQEHGADDGANVTADDGQASGQSGVIHGLALFEVLVV
jgi:hypothetical protein